MFDSLRRRVLGGPDEARRLEVELELGRTQEALATRREMLEEKRKARLGALFPDGPIAGAGRGPDGTFRFPDLDPTNFEESGEQRWYVAVATGIIDRFPGNDRLLSQLDTTFRAFHDANDLRVRPGGPHAELLAWRDAALTTWDLARDVPIFLGSGGGSRVLGCAEPFVVLDRLEVLGLPPDERRFVLTAQLGHLFFGNLRIFAFHRLMEVLDKMPSMSALVARGLGMIPVVGPTISRGLELARTVNDQMIRKTSLVLGLRQHILCDRLAVLGLGDPGPAWRFLVRSAAGDLPEGSSFERVLDDLVAQGGEVQARLEAGSIDVDMMSVVGPRAPFAAFRAFRLRQWLAGDTSKRIGAGLYVTRARLAEYKRTHAALEEELRAIEGRIVELHEKATKLEAELRALQAAEPAADAPPT